MLKLPKRYILALVVAYACRSKPPAKPSEMSEVSGAPEQPITVTAPPHAASELALPDGTTPLALAASPTRPEVAVLLRDAAGKTRVVSWSVGSDTTSVIAELQPGFTGRAIASHPEGTSLFVTGTSNGQTQVLRLDHERGSWRTSVVFETQRPIERLIVAPRPFQTTDGMRYRLLYAAKSPDGTSSIRSVTVTGKIDYQVVGPESTAETLPNVDEQPKGVVAPSGVPMAVHPRGEPLLWQDSRGCAHLLAYADMNWSTDRPLTSIPCGGSASITPNGAAYLSWRSGAPGVKVVRENARTSEEQATQYAFVAAPVSVPDGSGVIGFVSKGGSRSAIVYAPIIVPLADVANAWQLGGNACDEQLFATNAGLFREHANTDQLYSLYEGFNYGTDFPPPFLVTTDLFWENFGAAYNGVFIVLERRHAMPAFRAFVDAANGALGRVSPGSRWAKAFAAVAAYLHGDETGEAGRIGHANAPELSSVLDSTFDFAELTPRGHYTASPEMERYFRGVHYLTTLSRVMDPAPLGSLPPDVQRKAIDWIDVYRPFIAPPRSRLVWKAGAAATAPYAKHPWKQSSLFPLSWGIDNEVLESTVFHETWPVEERIVGPGGRRLAPSGLDVAAMFGNPLARSLLAPDLAAYPRLGPVLDGIAARRQARADSWSLYERWLDALAVEWADSSAIPGTPANSPVWPAKRLQTGLASWATLREATVLVSERASAAEAGEGGFEDLVPETPRGYVEPAPHTFEAIADLFDGLARSVSASHDLDSTGGAESEWKDEPLRQGILTRLSSSAAEARRLAQMAHKELRGEALSDSEYDAIRSVGGSTEHQFLLYKSLAEKDLALSTPDPLPKIADVAGERKLGLLEVAVGGPMEWDQIVPFFGRREIVIGSIYSYYEFLAHTPYDNQRWRKEIETHERPRWIQSLIASPEGSCRSTASR